MLPQITQIATD